MVTMQMDSLEWQQEYDIEQLHAVPVLRNTRERKEIPPDLTVADIDAFLRRMYALQQC